MLILELRKTEIKRLTGAVLTLASLFAASAPGNAVMMFFPTRPAGAKVSSVKGVLLHYGVGQAAGNVEIKTTNGRILNFFVGAESTIDGLTIDCSLPPHPWFKPQPGDCPVWPPYIRFGATVARVYFWHAVEPNSGFRVSVTDRLTTR